MSALLITLALLTGAPQQGRTITIGSKMFTESVILGDMAALLAQDRGFEHKHLSDLGGTRFLWTALLHGQIDAYPDYTGTIVQELLQDDSLKTLDQIRTALKPYGIGVTQRLGFVNGYGLALMPATAKKYNLKTISDLREHPRLRMGYGNEFMQRPEGWPTLSKAYRLQPETKVQGMDHSLAYQALKSGDLDIVDVYTTDAQIEEYNLVVLEDDLNHFPVYDAVFLYREDLKQQAPDFLEALVMLEGNITEKQMQRLNLAVDKDDREEEIVAAKFLAATLSVQTPQASASSGGVVLRVAQRVFQRTLEHLWLVVWSLGLAIFVAVPLGVLAAKLPTFWQYMIVGVVEVIQTIPGLALLVLLASLLGALYLPPLGTVPAIIALFLYSLLPVMRNTIAGIKGIPSSLTESAEVLGLSPGARLRLVELPMASPLILAGIKTTAVINVGYAALGGLIAAGGYGQTIMSGLRKMSVPLMLEGAIPAALLALAVKGLFELSERFLVPQGLRLKK